MANLLYNNLFSQSWQNIYDIINSRTNVADPSSSSSQKRKWVYSRVPDVKSITFKDFPFIVVHPFTVNFGDTQTGNRQTQTVNFVVEIEVFTCDRGSNNDDGKGMTYLDAISDDIVQALNSSTNRATLSGYGLKFVKPSGTDVNVEDFNNTLVYRRSFMVGFGGKKKVF
jgi:hypothetical protein